MLNWQTWLRVDHAAPGIRAPLPAWIARLVAGEHIVLMMTQVRGGSNAKAKGELDWRPAHRSWREGFAESLPQAVAQKSAA
jgi:hypothetical protein